MIKIDLTKEELLALKEVLENCQKSWDSALMLMGIVPHEASKCYEVVSKILGAVNKELKTKYAIKFESLEKVSDLAVLLVKADKTLRANDNSHDGYTVNGEQSLLINTVNQLYDILEDNDFDDEQLLSMMEDSMLEN